MGISSIYGNVILAQLIKKLNF